MKRYGKYRGSVVDNQDPKRLGRLRVQVPSLFGMDALWAMPCLPYAGKDVGLVLIPPKKASIWVEFEAGDPRYPIWTGCFFEPGQLPADLAKPDVMSLRTDSVQLVLHDGSQKGGVQLTISSPAIRGKVQLTIDAKGVQLDVDGTKAVLSKSEIALTNKSTSMKLQAAKLDARSGAATVQLQAPSVTVNNGAWKVT